MQLFGDLNTLSFIRISLLNWIDHVNNRMESKRKLSQVFKNNLQGRLLRGRRKNRWRNFVLTGINKFKIENWK